MVFVMELTKWTEKGKNSLIYPYFREMGMSKEIPRYRKDLKYTRNGYGIDCKNATFVLVGMAYLEDDFTEIKTFKFPDSGFTPIPEKSIIYSLMNEVCK
jgi:hypothetical protein